MDKLANQLTLVHKQKTEIVDNFITNKIEKSSYYPELNKIVRSSNMFNQTSRSGFVTPQKDIKSNFTLSQQYPNTTNNVGEGGFSSHIRIRNPSQDYFKPTVDRQTNLEIIKSMSDLDTHTGRHSRNRSDVQIIDVNPL